MHLERGTGRRAEWLDVVVGEDDPALGEEVQVRRLGDGVVRLLDPDAARRRGEEEKRRIP